ncbi:MAG: SDR family NAD(P)-dependent oxidoreductase [bacterium]
MKLLDGQRALITGAGSGIGKVMAQHFEKAGARIWICDADTNNLEQSLKENPDWNGTPCDVSEETQVDQLFKEMSDSCGGLEILVNNAGIAEFKPMLETSYDEWSRILAVNLNGPFICTQACAPIMLKNEGGIIVNIASISGLRASTLRIAYGTSKAALMHLTKQQAAELGNKGIRVNAIAPGPVDTAMAKKVHTADIRSDYHDVIPLNRYGLEEEIADAVWFLCSDSASYINGQIIAADGGFDATGIGLTSLRQSKN